MKLAAFGTLLIAGIVAAVALAQQRGEFPAQPIGTPQPATGSELIVVPTSLGDKGQMLTVVDPRQRVLCVYQIESATGKIALKSVRKIQWDLQMTHLNTENPLPLEIRSMLEQR